MLEVYCMTFCTIFKKLKNCTEIVRTVKHIGSVIYEKNKEKFTEV